MFKFFRRRAQPAVTPTGTRPPRIGGRMETTSPADLKRATRFAADFKVTGPFVEPDSDEHELGSGTGSGIGGRRRGGTPR